VVSAARSLLETDMSTVLIVDEAGERLEVAAAAGVDPDVAAGLSTPMGENLAGHVAQSGKPLRCCDVPADPRSRLAAVGEAGITSAMLSPLEHHGEVIGVLAVESIARRRFAPREQNLLQLMANQAATAIAKARLYHAERTHVEELRGLVDRVNNQYHLLSRTQDAHDRLTRVVLEGLGLGTLAQTTAELVGAPVALANQFGCLIHAAAPGSGDRAAELWRGCSADPRFAAQLAEVRENAGLGEPAFVGDGGCWRIVPAVAAGEALGFVVALEPDSLGEVEMTLLEQAATIVASELLRERGIAEAEARMHGDLLRSLLAGGGDLAQVHARAALLGHDLAEPQCVMVAAPAGGCLDASLVASAGGWASAQAGLRTIVAVMDGVAVALVESADRALGRECVEAWVDAFRRRLAALGHEGRLRVGVSGFTADAPDIRWAHESARQALAVSELDGSDDVVFFDEVELLATLVSAADREPMRRFVRRCIGKLAEYDEQRGSALTETLEVYLDHSGVARHAAKSLYLHPHSLRYRLRRIDEIQGIDLSNPTERLMAHLALKLRSVV
jgi:sugar diacid utilization regulator